MLVVVLVGNKNNLKVTIFEVCKKYKRSTLFMRSLSFFLKLFLINYVQITKQKTLSTPDSIFPIIHSEYLL